MPDSHRGSAGRRHRTDGRGCAGDRREAEPHGRRPMGGAVCGGEAGTTKRKRLAGGRTSTSTASITIYLITIITIVNSSIVSCPFVR